MAHDYGNPLINVAQLFSGVASSLERVLAPPKLPPKEVWTPIPYPRPIWEEWEELFRIAPDNYLVAGKDPEGRVPCVTFPFDYLGVITAAVGAPGQGKTTLFDAWATQIVMKTDSPVIFLDHKGQELTSLHNLFAAVECSRVRRRLKQFSMELHKPTFVFNALAELSRGRLTASRRAELAMMALGLIYPAAWSAVYFQARNQGLYRKRFEAVEKSIHARGNDLSFRDLFEIGDDEGLRGQERDHTWLARERLAELIALPQLNMTRRSRWKKRRAVDHAIRFDRTLEDNEVIYFHLNGVNAPSESRMIGGCALVGLVNAAEQYCQRHGYGKKLIYVFIDEFEAYAGSVEFLMLLAKARTLGLRFIVGMQSYTQLESRDVDMPKIIQDLGHIELTFTAKTEDEVQRVMRRSGECVYAAPPAYSEAYTDTDRGWSRTRGTSIRGERGFRFERNDILKLNREPGLCIFDPTDNGSRIGMEASGLMQTYRHISPEVYTERNGKAWPELTYDTIIPHDHEPSRPRRRGDTPKGKPPAEPAVKRPSRADHPLLSAMRKKYPDGLPYKTR